MINLAPEPGVPHPFDAFARRLLQADWESTVGPMRFSARLTLSDLADAAFLHNTRVLMAGLAAEQGTPATATGNLTRAFVGRLFDRLTLSARSRESIRAVCKVVNESDVWPLHLARAVAECAGLLARRNKRFQLWGRLTHATRCLGARRERTRPEQFLNVEIPMPALASQKVGERVSEALDALKHLQAETAAELDALLPASLACAFAAQL